MSLYFNSEMKMNSSKKQNNTNSQSSLPRLSRTTRGVIAPSKLSISNFDHEGIPADDMEKQLASTDAIFLSPKVQRRKSLHTTQAETSAYDIARDDLNSTNKYASPYPKKFEFVLPRENIPSNDSKEVVTKQNGQNKTGIDLDDVFDSQEWTSSCETYVPFSQIFSVEESMPVTDTNKVQLPPVIEETDLDIIDKDTKTSSCSKP